LDLWEVQPLKFILNLYFKFPMKRSKVVRILWLRLPFRTWAVPSRFNKLVSIDQLGKEIILKEILRIKLHMSLLYCPLKQFDLEVLYYQP
jgi:hypothetical protein